MKCRILFEPRDLWIGVYWTIVDKEGEHVYRFRHLYIYVCLIPMVPIRLHIMLRRKPDTTGGER